ncbi:hypothetical protein AWL63_20690 [Sphingomonas panacis]|uniref:DUF4136 domain-containing protein n=1 Tax=Sphingomonas panacis TaxID=1560345 RepID=A0A1B3ZF03_9SPHN|nr:hypothetical protein [Sphingomonas panacis]AOH86014.1 hypothetical protein AWL63_20690 [Sphingomonas panacis]
MWLPWIMAGVLAAVATPVEEAAPSVTPGTITIERDDGAAARDADPVFADAVRAASADANFIPLPAPSHSRYIAIIAVTRKSGGVVTSGTKGTAPAAGIANWGVGMGMRLPTTKDQLRGLVLTELTVTILLRSDKHPVWSGSAMTAQVDGTRAGAPDAVAGKLAEALFARFPSRLDAALSVP